MPSSLSPSLARWPIGLLAAALGFGLISCSADSYVEEADIEVYEILNDKRGAALGSDKAGPIAFSVDAAENTLRKRLLERIAKGETPELSLDLKRALEIAAENSEEFQQQRESLYFAALNLTGQRNRYTTIFSASGDLDANGVADDSANGGVGRGLTGRKLMATGASILGGFASKFVRVFTSGGGWDVSSLLSLSITQPLLQSFGAAVTMEPLTQAERDVIYAIRNYERFRRRFAVDVTSDYLSVIEARNSLRNSLDNLKSLENNRKRSEELAKAGRTPQFEVDQSLQRELTARNGVIRSRTSLQTQLDRFKITLGIPIECEIKLARDALERVREIGIKEPALDEEKAIELAMQNRLDLRNSIEQVEDAERKVIVAKDALKMGLDLSAAIDIPNEKTSNGFKLDWDKYQWQVGLALELPLNKTNERNSYRRALIGLQAELRSHGRFLDRIKQNVRTQLRNVEQALRSYRIEENAVKLAQTRVDSTRLLIEAGRATTRDFLDSQSSLLSAQDNLTSRLVDYFVANLGLLRELEMLDVGKDGLQVDVNALNTFRAQEPPAPESSKSSMRSPKPPSKRLQKPGSSRTAKSASTATNSGTLPFASFPSLPASRIER
ncbi:MAG: hypothetical protein CSA62_08460 [Planctomycetota bacterium]|nr:MAG: hypothetical protein CSA62_08460 [Planctomycetota bacterium]